jgi:MSHA biogenesis protein MshQ
MFRILSLLLSILLLTGVAQAGTVNFNGKNVGNCTLSGTTYTCGTAFLGATDTASIFTGYTVIVNGSLQLGWDQGLKMTGTARLETTGNGGIRLSGANPANINITGGTLKAAADFVLGGNRQDITADVIAATLDITGPGSKITGSVTTTAAVTLVSRSEITGAVSAGSLSAGADVILGGSVTTTGAIYLQSRTTVAGAVSGGSLKTESGAILNNTVKVDGLADFESGSMVYGNVTAGSLTLRPAGTTITGNVNVSGDVTMGSSTVINGDLVGNNVKTQSSNARINGNALVYSLYFAYGGTVSKVITCKVPGDFPCSCVTYESGYNYSPTCAAATPAGPHHFQITHGGSALTCQPQTVTVTACANAACTAPHYASSTSVTLQPGGKSFTFTGSTTAATVQQSTVGTAILAAPTASASVSCVNTSNSQASNQCAMAFDDTGLVVNVNNHIAMTTANVTIQALAASSNKQSCVPLVASKTENLDLSCAFVNPVPAKANANAKVTLINNSGSNSLSCGGAAARMPLAFNSDGLATATLTYPEAGQVSLAASYAGSASASFTAKGAGAFIAAPARFTIAATTVNVNSVSKTRNTVAAGTVIDASSAVFAKTGEPFTVTISAVNAKGDVTTNFGKESTPENFNFSTLAVDNPPDANNLGAITAGAWDAISNGVANSKTDTSGQWSFSDVGIIRLDATLAGSSGYYLGYSGNAVFKTVGTQKIGRIIPDHFDTTLPAEPANDTTMACSVNGGAQVVTPCVLRFIYSHQPFKVVATAYNNANVVTGNYQGALAKAITLSAVTTNGGAAAVTTGAMGSNVANVAPGFTFTKGVGIINTSANTGASLPLFAFTPKPTATTGTRPTQFYVRAIDTDLVTSQRTGAVEQPVTAVSGRLLVPNVDGSPSSALPVTVQAQFYHPDRGGYVLNPMYGAAAPTPAGYMLFDHCQKGLASNAATYACTSAAQLQLMAPGTTAFAAGLAKFRLAAPAPGNISGSVNLTLLQPCASGPCVQWIDYLPSTTGKLTFGVYRSGPVIYTREVY